MNNQNHFISCDWGSSSLKLNLFDKDQNSILQTKTFDQGIIKAAECKPKDRPAFLKDILETSSRELCGDSAQELPVVMSGMITSSIGWHELVYQKTPFALDASNYIFRIDGRFHFLSGVCTDCDVMRGEETQLIGLFANADLKSYLNSALVILPGTHSKHCVVVEGKLVDFSTFMTGEFYKLLSQNSILKHSVGEVRLSPEILKSKQDIFAKGVQQGSQISIMSAAFQVRVKQLFKEFSSLENAVFLSGLLLGQELADIKADQQVIIAAQHDLLYIYEQAAKILNLNALCVQPEVLESAACFAHKNYLLQVN